MAGQLTIDTLKASSGVLATQNGMTGIAKAWCNFGAVGGTVTIRNSFNVSSITRNGTGDYSVNFSTAMANNSYAPVVATNGYSNGSTVTLPQLYNYNDNTYYPTTSSFRFTVQGTGAGGSPTDVVFASTAVFGS